jgi:hypothetical protein
MAAPAILEGESPPYAISQWVENCYLAENVCTT